MSDEYLDAFLLALIEKDGQALKERDLLRMHSIGNTNNDFDASIRHLVNEGMITQERAGADYLLTITTLGQRFIQTGGFAAQTQRNNAGAEANRIARSAKRIAVWAIIISAVVALAVGLMTLKQS